MKLDELGLNRFMFKAQQELNTVDSSLMSSDSQSTIGGSNSESGTPEQKDAKNILTATVISSCIIQTSGSPNRVELIPYISITPGLPGPSINPVTKNDSLVARNAENIVVVINKDGISALVIFSQDIATVNLTTNDFDYFGVPQPVIYTGIIDASGAPVVIPPGWTCTNPGAGHYTITHNLGTIPPKLIFSVTSRSLPLINYVLESSLNDFDVFFSDIAGVPTNTNFNFSVMRSLP